MRTGTEREGYGQWAGTERASYGLVQLWAGTESCLRGRRPLPSGVFSARRATPSGGLLQKGMLLCILFTNSSPPTQKCHARCNYAVIITFSLYVLVTLLIYSIYPSTHSPTHSPIYFPIYSSIYSASCLTSTHQTLYSAFYIIYNKHSTNFKISFIRRVLCFMICFRVL